MQDSFHRPGALRRRSLCALAVFGGALALASDAPAAERAQPWTRWVDADLSARDVGLRAAAPADRLARAALKRHERPLGLRGSELELAGDVTMPAADGARAARYLRYRQAVAGLRVTWSQIDVTVVAGRVRSIAATVVPVDDEAAVGKRRVTRARALRIARRAVAGPDRAMKPLPVAYAGKPTTDRAAGPRRAHRAWVVEVHRPTHGEDEAPTGLCLVVDAESGKVIARWPGMAARPRSGRDARGVRAAAAQAAGDPRERSATVLQVFDGTGMVQPPPHTQAPLYSSFRTAGSTRVSANWPFYPNARLDDVAEVDALEALGANAANAARTICVVRGWCGSLGSFQPGANRVRPWIVIGNTTDTTSRARRDSLRVFVADDHIFGVGGNPNLPFNDIVAHEYGHIMDWIYAGDRVGGQALEGDAVEEALADMFAYDYDRENATIAEDTGGAFRDWKNPGSLMRAGQPYPDHMSDYDPSPPINADGDPSPHFNSTILSHAYYRVVQSLGHNKAGRVLHNVPQRLSPRPTFQEVRRAFHDATAAIYGVADAVKVTAAFTAVGLAPPPHQEPDCGPHAC